MSEGDLPVAEYRGEIQIGEMVIPCAVLNDGQRVLSEHGISNALGGRSGYAKRRSKASEDAGAPLPVFLASNNLKPFISNDLLNGPLQPIEYYSGKQIVSGFPAEVLPEVCDIWLSARAAGALNAQQAERAQAAEILSRGLANLGIIGLVDEATGYQEIRDRKALQAILDKYIKKEFAAWAKRFPDEFYKELFRLRGWKWNPITVAKPSVVGHYTNDIVYERLAPGILEELQSRNPQNKRGRRKVRHHQYLTEDIGHPALAQHLHAVIGLMRASSNWEQFWDMLNRAFPKKDTQWKLDLD